MKIPIIIFLFVYNYSFTQGDSLKLFFQACNSSKVLNVQIVEVIPYDELSAEEILYKERLENFIGFADTLFAVFVPFGHHYIIRVEDEKLKVVKMADIYASTTVLDYDYPYFFTLDFSIESKEMVYFFDPELKEYTYFIKKEKP